MNRAGSGPAALVVAGEAGIGKTTFLLEAVERARECGFLVLSAHGALPEVSLAYTALADLLDDVDDALFADLPEPQRLALERARSGTADGPPTAERVAATGFLTLLQRLSQSAPVLVAVDDVQWLDPASRTVLAYAARRLTGRVGLLVTVRTGEPAADTLAWLQMRRPDMVMHHTVKPMSLGALHAMIAARRGQALPRPEITRIHRISGGNPFFALELARAVDDADSASTAPLPDSLSTLVRERTGVFEDDVVAVLLIAALAVDPTTDVLAEVTAHPIGRILELLEPAEARGVVVLIGCQVRFAHPLLAAGIVAHATPVARRAAHRDLAAAVAQPELKARHLALGSADGDPATLAALDAAATATRAQGAPATAAELLELAIRLGGDTPIRHILAAGHHFAAGDADSARNVLGPALANLERGPLRSMALALLAGICSYAQGFNEAERYALEALDGAEGNPSLEVGLYLMLALCQLDSGRLDSAAANLDIALERAEKLGSGAITSQVLAFTAVVAGFRGQVVDPVIRRRALELEVHSPDVPVPFRARVMEAHLRSWEGDLDGARELLEREWQACLDWAAEPELLYMATHRGPLAIWRGDLAEAAMIADEALERAQQLGGDNSLSLAMTIQVAAAAYQGRVEDARRCGLTALDIADRTGLWRSGEWPRLLLGFLEVSLGRHPEAMEYLDPLVAAFPANPCTELGLAWFVPDAIEALVGLGRLDDAERLIARMEHNGARLDRPWMLCVGMRGRAMLLAARADLDGGEEMAQRALAEHDRLPMPFERARTLLLLGQIQRRRRHRGDATATLTEALQLFEKIGAQLWVDRADDELRRISARSATFGLTAAEMRVAQRAAAGLSNKEIAAELFISAKTVEMNLSRVYRKLGIRSRAQLASCLGGAGES